jgi:hypothetical protein
MSSVQEAIDFLKRLEILAGNDTKKKPDYLPNNLNPVPNKGPQQGQRNDKYKPNQQLVKHVRRDHRNNCQRDNYDRSGHCRRRDSSENESRSNSHYSSTRLSLTYLLRELSTS